MLAITKPPTTQFSNTPPYPCFLIPNTSVPIFDVAAHGYYVACHGEFMIEQLDVKDIVNPILKEDFQAAEDANLQSCDFRR